MLRRARAATAALALWAGLGAPGCTGKGAQPEAQERAPAVGAPVAGPAAGFDAGSHAGPGAAGTPGAAVTPGPIDVHVHLTAGKDDELVALLDQLGVARAVVLASPHLDIAQARPSLSEYRAANEVVLAAAAAHPGRLIPFVTVELGEVEPGYVREVLDRGACGVKIYEGHRALRERPLAHASHREVWALLEQRRVPVLLHVNTVRYRDDLVALMTGFPGLRVACAHLCGSRTDLDRLAGIMAELPGLLFDTSHGGQIHGAAGFANLERERERVVAMMRAAPGRFLFGSDLVTTMHVPGWQRDWQVQVQANLDFLRAPRFRFWRPVEGSAMMTIQDYQGLALEDELLARVLRGNAERWLAPCLARR